MHHTQPCYREFNQDVTYSVLPLVGMQYWHRIYKKKKKDLKTLVVFWKMAAYQTIYTVLVITSTLYVLYTSNAVITGSKEYSKKIHLLL